MTFEQIRLLILVAQHHNITRAARELRMTQSTASRRLKQLENELRFKLFKKTGNGIELTESGESFLHRALPIREQLERLEESYAPSVNAVAIAASYRPSKYLLPPLLTEFNKKHPSAQVTLRTHSSLEIERLLTGAKVDLGITTNPSMSPSLFEQELCFSEPLTAFVAADHPLGKVTSLRSAELGTIPVILKARQEGESRTEALLNKCEKEGMRFKTVIRCDSPDVVKEFVRYGAGVGFLYYNSIKRGIERGKFKVIAISGLEQLVGQNYLVYPKEKPLSRLAEEFLSFLRAALKKTEPVNPITALTRKTNGSTNGNLGDPMPLPRLLCWMVSITSVEWVASALM